ncbi:hypothetical protein [Bradyrhizobium sp. LCT2]|uniref:hypothetical protein n=1 Tax=Bradyrhizobium sp. LCT2 TaxID=2493093 RepID=UPI0013750C22|nr:hypothetical protein [Bradyrhizobium sp. LCT2]
MGIRTCDLVEFAPRRRQLAVAALATIPTFVIGCSEAIPNAIHEAEDTFIVLCKRCEAKGVQQEAKNDIMT